ncbi:LAMI_0H13696g1_1 [Lachancea mirantina]|uniref:LAMI_0H13696g1_1 n=1 Tax=Lachancea mirantina TaxID=1230905 RepID=A0A1G4KI92_9SACH|nr:LAMI_0H13696g1_1 [Lachancea mirantina]
MLPKINKKGRVPALMGAMVLIFVIIQLKSFSVTRSLTIKFKTIVPTTSHTENINLKKFKPPDVPVRSVEDLRSQLAKQFPYNPLEPIPRRVWQTWKCPLDSPEFPAKARKYAQEWIQSIKHSMGYDYALVPDDRIMPLLQNIYGGVPQVIQAFEALPLPILKADFFRYLILYARGGIYSDLDTVPLKTLTDWPSVNGASWLVAETPIKYKNFKATDSQVAQEPGFVIGIEADPDRPDWNEHYARRIQFCQWTIQSKPGHPLLRELILNITATTLGSTVARGKYPAPKFEFPKEIPLQDYSINCRDKKLNDAQFSCNEKKTPKNTDHADIMNWTGPGAFSDAVMAYLNNLIHTNDDILIINNNMKGDSSDDSSTTKKFYRKITEGLQAGNFFQWEFFTLIKEPVVVDDVMVLPITSFSPDVGHMGSGSSTDEIALVKHMFEGSWKGE